MARNQTIRIRPVVLQADVEALIPLRTMSDYAPVNPAYAKSIAEAKLSAMRAAQDAELIAQSALATARDVAAAAEWDYHNTMLGVKSQVIAQYGNDSNELQSFGLKKKSERKMPVRRQKPALEKA